MAIKSKPTTYHIAAGLIGLVEKSSTEFKPQVITKLTSIVDTILSDRSEDNLDFWSSRLDSISSLLAGLGSNRGIILQVNNVDGDANVRVYDTDRNDFRTVKLIGLDVYVETEDYTEQLELLLSDKVKGGSITLGSVVYNISNGCRGVVVSDGVSRHNVQVDYDLMSQRITTKTELVLSVEEPPKFRYEWTDHPDGKTKTVISAKYPTAPMLPGRTRTIRMFEVATKKGKK